MVANRGKDEITLAFFAVGRTQEQEGYIGALAMELGTCLGGALRHSVRRHSWVIHC